MHVASAPPRYQELSLLQPVIQRIRAGISATMVHAWMCMHLAWRSGAPCFTPQQPISQPLARLWHAPWYLESHLSMLRPTLQLSLLRYPPTHMHQSRCLAIWPSILYIGTRWSLLLIFFCIVVSCIQTPSIFCQKCDLSCSHPCTASTSPFVGGLAIPVVHAHWWQCCVLGTLLGGLRLVCRQ